MERFHFLKNKFFIQAYLDLLENMVEKGSNANAFSKLMGPIMLNHYQNHHFIDFSKDQIREELNAHYDFQQSIGRIKVKRI